MKQDSSNKIAVLMRLYGLFHRVSSGWRTACAQGCSACCTSHVTLTTLEGRAILDHLNKTNSSRLLERLRPQDPGVFEPVITTNGLAACCFRQEEPPEEEKPADSPPCPFLENGACLVYPARPLNCRVMVSKAPCRTGGWAEMDEIWVTVNQVFLQAVEAMDRPGLFGALPQVLRRLASGEPGPALLENQPMPGLLIPPEHRQALSGIVAQIRQVLEGVR